MADDSQQNAAAVATAAHTGLSQDEIDYLTEAAKDLTPDKVLVRIAESDKAIISTVGTIGTLLAGFGGVAAAISVTRSTVLLGDVPIIPVGALATSVLASIAVAVALVGSRPVFEKINPNNLLVVKKWLESQVSRGRRTVRIASRFFIAAALTAVVTSTLAGWLAIRDAQTDPRSLAALEASVGDKGAVKVQLSGAVDGLDESEHLSVIVVSRPTSADAAPLITIEVYPDGDGKVALDADAVAPTGSTQVIAKVWVVKEDESPQTYRAREPLVLLTARYPKVAEPESPATQPATTP